MLPLHPALLSQPDYLFSQIAAAAEEERKRHPHRRVISLGIGDVTQPIAPVAAAALRTAEHMAQRILAAARTIAAIAKQQPFYFVMADRSLASDNVADNFEQLFEEYSPDTQRRIL